MSRPSWIGQTLGGRYQIQEIVGQGGMSAVYKAMDPNLQRVVAVKLVHPHLADDPKFVERFEEEARAVAQLRHPNIVQVYDFDHAEDIYYMVQEFVPGETLQQRLRRLDQSGRKMDLGEVTKYSLDILNAMGYAHQRGMIHRDIKPANIMLDVMGRAILMDFGIVKIMGGQKHTATGAVVGTAMYMCPEMIRGEQPDARSDIYSLGVTLFEMVNGRPPYEAESAMTLMMMHLNDPLPNLQSMRPDVPGDLVAVIEKSLAKNRDERFRSTAEMAAALSRVQDRLRSGVPFDATMVEGDLGSGRSETTAEPAGAGGAQPEAEDEPTPERPASRDLAAAAGAAAAGAAASRAEESRQPPEELDPQADPKQALPYDSTPEGTLIEPPVDTGPESSRPPAGATPVEPKMGVGTPPVVGGGAGAATRGGVPGAGDSGAGTGGSGAGGVQGGGPPSAPAGAPAAQPAGGRPNWLLYVGGGVLVVAAVLVIGLLLGSQLGGEDEPGVGLVPQGTQGAADTAELLPAETATETPTLTPEPTATETLPPTETPTITPTPTLEALPTRTPPGGVMFVRINDITLRGDGHYEVAYETFEYTETLPGDHVHFFWNTVSETNAGNPGNGPWILYGGPRPFTKYARSQRPANAGAMCALVANPDHSIQPGSGTCWPLPDVPVVTALEETQCLSNPSGSYEVENPVPKWENMLVKGTLESGGWFYVVNPADKNNACWVPEGGLFKTGDWSGVPNVTPQAP